MQLAYGLHDDGYRDAKQAQLVLTSIDLVRRFLTPPNRDRSSWGVQMNACFDNIQSRLDSEAEMRRIEEERVAQEARAKADAAIAERKAAEEAAAAVAEAEAVRLAPRVRPGSTL